MVHWWVLVYCGRRTHAGIALLYSGLSILSGVKAQHDNRKVSKASSCNYIFPSKVLSGCTENFNPPQLWHMPCTILQVPLRSFLSTFNHDHLPSCSSVWHKFKESNGLILPWLRFASKSLLQIFIKVSSLVGLVAELLLRLL
jgi:hypothetical protein